MTNNIAQWPQLTSESRPWTRWWWLGSSVNRENITDLLQRYADAGIGGVEITPIYGVQNDEACEIEYLSPHWVEILEYTIREAHRLGMQVDMPTGTGWPFGGPQVSEGDALDKLLLEHVAVDPNTPILRNHRDKNILAATAYGADGQIVRLDDHVRDGRVDWDVPKGTTWDLYITYLTWGGRSVKRAAPGGAGKCINPFSKESLSSYLARFDKALASLPPGSLRCHFHDSFEYLADFSPDLFNEFKQRRGYDLAEHLDALLGNIDDPDRTARVKTDYRETISEMLLENFTQAWTHWSHSKGSLSRNQAHGSPGNLLDLYAAPDIPETETFGGVGDPIVNKFASSAAHVSGKNLCSSETCTWLDEHFNVSLAQCKDAIDGLFVSGINHIFYHGTAYSPMADKWPGRLFYASTTFAPQDPLWQDFPALNTYTARVQSILQSGQPDNDVLIYWPLSDLWMNSPHVYMLEIGGAWLAGQPFAEVSSYLWNKGCQFDYVSDRQLEKLTEEPGQTNYRAIVVPACDYIPLKTLESLCRLAESGVTVVFVDHMPSDVPGYADLNHRQGEFLRLKDRMGGKIVAKKYLLDHIEKAGARSERIVDITGVQTIRRQSGFGTDYFITNRGEQTIDGWVTLNTAGSMALLMDPMTGETGTADTRQAEAHLEIRLQLSPNQSIVIRVIKDEQQPPVSPWSYIVLRSDPVALTGNWTLEFLHGGPTCLANTTSQELGSWTDLNIDRAQDFSGTARYSITFDAPAPSLQNWLLDLGIVADSASVTLNGHLLGTLISPPFQLKINGLAASGNHLEICVTNVAANRIRSMDMRGETWRIFNEINFVNREYKPFDASNSDVRPAGLIGPVTLTPI